MDFIKTELQDNNNSFDLSCVEVKLEDIKNELVTYHLQLHDLSLIY